MDIGKAVGSSARYVGSDVVQLAELSCESNVVGVVERCIAEHADAIL